MSLYVNESMQFVSSKWRMVDAKGTFIRSFYDQELYRVLAEKLDFVMLESDLIEIKRYANKELTELIVQYLAKERAYFLTKKNTSIELAFVEYTTAKTAIYNYINDVYGVTLYV